MVCNVNGPDGFLSIRSGPGSDFEAVRKLKRLAIVEVDDSERRAPLGQGRKRISHGFKLKGAVCTPRNFQFRAGCTMATSAILFTEVFMNKRLIGGGQRRRGALSIVYDV